MAGNVSIPAILRFTSGFPSVEATAIPPWFAVVSLEDSLFWESVVNPKIISASDTLKFSTRTYPVVPPIVIFPVTFKLLLTWRSLPIVTFPGIVGFDAKATTGVEPSPVPLVTVIWFEAPEIDWT